jgi:hypothetical protein
MSSLLQVQDKLQEVIAEISQLEFVLSANPTSGALRANIHSLQKLQKTYEEEWLDETDKLGMDVCSYRVFTGPSPTIHGLARALDAFQHMFSVIFDAIQGGPKIRGRVSVDSERATAFQFGYTFPGSVGVVLTLPNRRLLPMMETNLDKTFEAIDGLSRSRSPEEISNFVRILGPASVRATYQWARDHTENGLGADIQWRRNQEVRRSVLRQRPELDRLKSAIEVVSEETEEPVEVRGVLVGVNTISRTFHIAVTAFDADIRGRYTDAISEAQRVTLPKTYTAFLKKKTRLVLSTGKEETDYFLERLAE